MIVAPMLEFLSALEFQYVEVHVVFKQRFGQVSKESFQWKSKCEQIQCPPSKHGMNPASLLMTKLTLDYFWTMKACRLEGQRLKKSQLQRGQEQNPKLIHTHIHIQVHVCTIILNQVMFISVPSIEKHLGHLH